MWNGNGNGNGNGNRKENDRGDYNSSFALHAVELKKERSALSSLTKVIYSSVERPDSSVGTVSYFGF